MLLTIGQIIYILLPIFIVLSQCGGGSKKQEPAPASSSRGSEVHKHPEQKDQFAAHCDPNYQTMAAINEKDCFGPDKKKNEEKSKK